MLTTVVMITEDQEEITASMMQDITGRLRNKNQQLQTGSGHV